MESHEGNRCRRLQERHTDYLEGATTARESEELEAHLETCPGCRDALDDLRRTTALLAELREEEVPPGSRRRALAGWRLLADLWREPPARRAVMVRNSRRYRTESLCELLLEESFENGFRSPAKAVELAELGLLVAEALAREGEGAPRNQDLLARAWAFLANARRVGSDLEGAEKAFEAAEAALETGSGDRLEQARLLDLKASLRGDQGRFHEALVLLEQVLSEFDEIGDEHLLGRTLISKAMHMGRAGAEDAATSLLKKALLLLDFGREPRLLVFAKHNLVLFLVAQGRFHDASEALKDSRELYDNFGNPYSQAGLSWLKGKIALGLENLVAAEEFFSQARVEFLEMNKPLDVAQVSLDLAELYLKQGRTAEVRELVATMLPVFQSRDLDRDTRAALRMFRRAVEMESLSLALVRQVAETLERCRAGVDQVTLSW